VSRDSIDSPQEVRQTIKKVEEACGKVVSISLPAVQRLPCPALPPSFSPRPLTWNRNHKALLDEVLRVEEGSTQVATRTEVTEKALKVRDCRPSSLLSLLLSAET
jgi:hypothetical protein